MLESDKGAATIEDEDGATKTIATDRNHISDWRQRPWLLALILAIAGLLAHFFSDGGKNEPIRMALTAACVFGPLAAAFTLSPNRWKSAGIYSLAVALVMAGIAWRVTSAGDHHADTMFWVAAGLIAVTLSLPLFMAGFHQLRWQTSYKETHFHVWTGAVTGVGALAFVCG